MKFFIGEKNGTQLKYGSLQRHEEHWEENKPSSLGHIKDAQKLRHQHNWEATKSTRWIPVCNLCSRSGQERLSCPLQPEHGETWQAVRDLGERVWAGVFGREGCRVGSLHLLCWGLWSTFHFTSSLGQVMLPEKLGELVAVVTQHFTLTPEKIRHRKLQSRSECIVCPGSQVSKIAVWRFPGVSTTSQGRGPVWRSLRCCFT